MRSRLLRPGDFVTSPREASSEEASLSCLRANLRPPLSRVGDWRAGSGRSSCSLLARSVGCECHTIWPCHVSSPRLVERHARFRTALSLFDFATQGSCGFPVTARARLLSCQGWWDLSCWGDFRPAVFHPIAVGTAPSAPTPPRPAEALSVPELNAPDGTFSRNARTVSAFALTYILRLRSCASMDAFVISSLPSLRSETLQTAGPLRSTGVTPLRSLRRTQPPPSRLRPTSRLRRLYDLPCSGDFSLGTRRASPVARHALVTVLSLPPRRSQSASKRDPPSAWKKDPS